MVQNNDFDTIGTFFWYGRDAKFCVSTFAYISQPFDILLYILIDDTLEPIRELVLDTLSFS